MKIEQIDIRGFKSFEKLQLPLSQITVLIGANGSGKSNLLSAFHLLHQIAEDRFAYAVAKAGGAHSLLFNGPETTGNIEFLIRFQGLKYHAIVEVTSDDNLIFVDEQIGRSDYTHPSGVFETPLNPARSNNRESILNQRVYTEPGIEPIRSFFSGIQIYHFHDTSYTSGARLLCQRTDAHYLKPDGSNLAAFLNMLSIRYLDHYQQILRTIQMGAPFFHSFLFRPTPENSEMIRLEWRELGTEHIFQGHQMSDGLLRFTLLVTLLMQPVPFRPPIIIIDEPELGLHPVAIDILGGLIRSAAAFTQILITTQSPLLLNQFTLDEIRIVERKSGYSTITIPDTDQLRQWLDEYSPAELWQSGLLGGDPVSLLR
ncbi:MAG: AAA family ATPase [Methanospirillaceae archaeon]|nr:AAA family ATPase [Methanospirillaceae archaeon]